MLDKYNNFEIGFDSNNTKKEWFEKINTSFPDITEDIFDDICNYILNIDKNIDGRFGGGVKDLIAVAASRYVTTKKFINTTYTNLAHVEIGTLFGGTAILTDYILKLQNGNKKFKNIMIDPLCGYYDNSIDFISGLEVTPDRLIKNLEKFNVQEYELITKYSTEEEAIKKIKNLNVASLFIDGDHSFAGLLKDWNNYNGCVIEGGHIIIDNVNDKNWPNINLFIQILKSKINSKWEVVYEENITIILEKKSINDLQIDNNFNIDIIHQIERQVDEKFYNIISNRNKTIEKYKTMLENRNKEIEKLSKQVEYRNKYIYSIKETKNNISKIKFFLHPINKYKLFKQLLKDIDEA